jgi:hypothetical protein
MAALVAANVTVVVTKRWWEGLALHAIGTIAFGDGALTYPTAGVPLPAKEKFGFSRSIDSLAITGQNARTVSYLPAWVKATNALQLFEEEASAAGGPLLEADTSEAPAAVTFDFHAVGS